jgi:isoquinoline 1-oxidoreductase beta subunit
MMRDSSSVRLTGSLSFTPPLGGSGVLLYGAITLKDGRIEQNNFNNYRVLRMNEMPKVEVHIVPSTQAPTGVGEPGVAPLGPAVANAIFAATGTRMHVLPFQKPGAV